VTHTLHHTGKQPLTHAHRLSLCSIISPQIRWVSRHILRQFPSFSDVAGHERQEKGCRGTHGVLGSTVEKREEGEANKSKHDKRAIAMFARRCRRLHFIFSSSGRI
jgi:hypothetical protein